MAAHRAASVSLRFASSSLVCRRCAAAVQPEPVRSRLYSAASTSASSLDAASGSAPATSAKTAPLKTRRPRRTRAEIDELVAKGLMRDRRKKADSDAPKPKKGRRPTVVDGTVTNPLKLPKHRRRTPVDETVQTLRESMSEQELEKVLSEEPLLHAHLPPRRFWRDLFPFQTGFLKAHRYFVSNRDTAKKIVDSLKLGERGGRKATIVEAYPGPGILTRAFLDSEHVEKVIALEDQPIYTHWLNKLADEPDLRERPERFQLIPQSGFQWEAYEDLVDSGGLAHLQGRIHRADGSEVNVTAFERNFEGIPHADPSWTDDSDLIFVAQLPITVHSEQLFAQLIHAIYDRAWLFRYSRVRMVFVASEFVSARAIARAGEHDFRGKISVMAQSVADTNVIVESNALLPSEDHMFPPVVTIGQRLPSFTPHIGNMHVAKGEGRKSARSQLNVCEVVPRKKLLMDTEHMDTFDYLTRNLFVTRSKSIQDALLHVAPGAQAVLRRLHPEHPSMADRPAEEAILPDTAIWDLTNTQWQSLTRKFDLWPFKPELMIEGGRLDRKSIGNKVGGV